MEWPNITEQKDPPNDADEWREVKNKVKYLEKQTIIFAKEK